MPGGGVRKKLLIASAGEFFPPYFLFATPLLLLM